MYITTKIPYHFQAQKRNQGIH
uniref:Uncharacterized protein n=1 Tax=Arundo donax TaxID=35708 RepID=A0A0A9ENT4_ARUDO